MALPALIHSLHFKSEPNGIMSRIEVDGNDVSRHVQTFVLSHKAGDVPRAILETVEPSDVEWQGDAVVAVSFRCPVCDRMHVCAHEDGVVPDDLILEVTSVSEKYHRQHVNLKEKI